MNRHHALGLWAGVGLTLALGLVGCAGPQQQQRPALTVATSAEAALPELRDGGAGRLLTAAELDGRLGRARAIFVGEQHSSAASHRAQLAILRAVYRLDPDVGLGIEMLPQRLQPQLDAFLAGSVDEAGFLAAVDWPHTWGFDYALYRPLFDFCRQHGLRIYALNAPRELSKAVRQHGLDGLSAAEQAQLPSGQPWPRPEPHRQLLRAIFDGHPAAPGSDPKLREAAFERFYSAQLVWDESMAQAVAAILGPKSGPQRLVVLAGAGHVGRDAMPGRAVRRGVSAILTLAPVEQASDPLPQASETVDLLMVVGSDPEGDSASSLGRR